MIIFVLVLVISICISQCMKKGKRLIIPSSEYYRRVAAQKAVEQYHAIALKLVKEKAKTDIENLFEKMKGPEYKDVYSYLKDVGDKVREVHIPPDSPPAPVDPSQTSEVLMTDGRREMQFEMQLFCSGEDRPLISPV